MMAMPRSRAPLASVLLPRDKRGVSDPAPLLGRQRIEEAFRVLGDRLAKRGVVADIKCSAAPE